MDSTLISKKTLQLQWEIRQQQLFSESIEAVRSETEQLFNVAVPVCVIDKQFTVYRVNDTFCDLFDCRKDEVVGKQCSSIWKSSVCGTDGCPLRIVTETGRPFSSEGSAMIRNGRKKICMVTAKPFFGTEGKITGIVENIIDITRRKEVEEELEKKKELLQEQNRLLEQKNSALLELMELIRFEKKRTREQIIDNVEYLVGPLIEKLKSCCSGREATFIRLLEANLHDLTSSFGSTMTRNMLRLSPQEIAICNIIRNGCDTKEIADLLHLSVKTIETHRKNIRRKLGIANRKENLYTCLSSLH